MRTPTWRIAGLLFGSGFCALVYQIAWFREFRLIFGASTGASAAVLAIFVGGLGAGGILLGPRADRHPRPLWMYAQLEAVAALSAALTPWLLSLINVLYVSAGGTTLLGVTIGTIARLALAALVLAVPTIAMGGTLPAAARSTTPDSDTGRRETAALYGINTCGAVAGCLAATFVLLELLGTRATIWLAAAVNALIALQAWRVETRLKPDTVDGETPDAPPSAPKPEAAKSRQRGKARKPEEAPADRVEAAVSHVFVLVASAIVGFAFFLMELVWYRMLAPLLGGSVFSFGVILAVALAGIGAGGLWYALVGRGRQASLVSFTWTCALEAAAIAIPFAAGDWLAMLALVLRPEPGQFAAQVASWTAVAALIVLPTAIVAGYQFPLLIALFGQGGTAVGRHVGTVYGANTLGAMAGSLAGGFGLLPWLSALGAWRFDALLLVGLGLAAIALAWPHAARRALIGPLAMCVAVPICFVAVGPTTVWRHSAIGAGRAELPASSWNTVREWGRDLQRAVIWDEDGTESSVALAMDVNGLNFVVNGKADGSARADAGTQVMHGLLGALLRPQARRSLVVGLGTGSTAGWMGAVPTMERVDVVELEPLILEIARVCDEVNHDVLRNPKVHIAIGDGREALLTSRETYDLIASEPSNPFRAGIASLFTHEYYRAASNRLADDGLFLQWVQLYEIDERTLNTVYATIASVFPHVEAWEAGGSDLVLVGAKRPLVHDADALAARIQEEPFKQALTVAWRAVDLNGVLAHFLANERFTPAIVGRSGTAINTDDRNIVEFGFARSLGTSASLLVTLRAAARASGQNRPLLAETAARTIDWGAVDTAWVAYQATEGNLVDVKPEGSAQEAARQTALMQYYGKTDAAAARQAWSEQGRVPMGPTELAMIADLDAENGSETALGLIDQLRRYTPGEADTILATLRFRQGRFDDAGAALEDAFDHFRSDPWALTRFKQRAVALAAAVSTRSQQLALRMHQALSGAFAVRALDDERVIVRASLTRLAGLERLCEPSITPLEPHVPWTGAFLTLRRNCYQLVRNPRLRTAERELQDFESQARPPLLGGF